MFICTDAVEKNLFPWGHVSPADGPIRGTTPSANSQLLSPFGIPADHIYDNMRGNGPFWFLPHSSSHLYFKRNVGPLFCLEPPCMSLYLAVCIYFQEHLLI